MSSGCRGRWRLSCIQSCRYRIVRCRWGSGYIPSDSLYRLSKHTDQMHHHILKDTLNPIISEKMQYHVLNFLSFTSLAFRPSLVHLIVFRILFFTSLVFRPSLLHLISIQNSILHLISIQTFSPSPN